jgi:hypothetical protein
VLATDWCLEEQTAGIDVRVCDIGEAVEEVMSSYEVTMPGVNGGLPMQGESFHFPL